MQMYESKTQFRSHSMSKQFYPGELINEHGYSMLDDNEKLNFIPHVPQEAVENKVNNQIEGDTPVDTQENTSDEQTTAPQIILTETDPAVSEALVGEALSQSEETTATANDMPEVNDTSLVNNAE